MRKGEFDPCIAKTPWRRAWQPTPVFLPGESCGQRSLGGYSPWVCKESDTTEQLSMHACNGKINHLLIYVWFILRLLHQKTCIY